MLLKVNLHKIEIVKEPVNEREINISKCQFEFADEITSDYVKEAYFTFEGTTYKQIIVNNECYFPSEVLAKKGTVEIGVIAYLVENEEEIKRYNPSPVYFDTWVGSLKDDVENSEEITPSDKEQMEQQILNVATQMDNLDVEATKVEHTTTITITKKDGTSYDVQVLDGEKGDKGDKGDAGSIRFIIVTVLPTENIDVNAIYLVPNLDPEIDNSYIEYIYVDNKWEKLGETQIEVDLSDYYTKQETNGLLNAKANANDLSAVATSGSYNDLNNKPIIPTKTSDLTNDSDFTTKSYVDSLVGDVETLLETLDIGNGV